MAKKTPSRAASMDSLFPQYDQQELEQTLPRQKKPEPARQAAPMKKPVQSGKPNKLDTKARPALQTPQNKMVQPKIPSPETPKVKLKAASKDKVSEKKQPDHATPIVTPLATPIATSIATVEASLDPQTLSKPEPLELQNPALSPQIPPLLDSPAPVQNANQDLAKSPKEPVGLPVHTGLQSGPAKEVSGRRPLLDIPEDALPPPRPEPILALRPSVPLHAKLIAQARDEGISVESLALEMLAESVVLRAWEIVERKNAMRGHNQGQPPHQRNPNHRPPRSGNYSDGAFNSSAPSHHNGHHNNYHSGHGQPRDQRGGYRRPHQGWKDDQSQFLEYVRNQEKRNRR